MKPHRAQLAKIHIAVKQLGLSDESYRDILFGHFGVDSAAKLTSVQAAVLIDLFTARGFRAKKSPVRQRKRNGSFIAIPSGPAAQTQRKVLAMWNSLGYSPDKLHSRCKTQFGVDRFEWLTDRAALNILITDLKKRQENQQK